MPKGTMLEAVERLRQRRIDWAKAHPNATAIVQFNTTGLDWILADLTASIAHGLIRFNQAGHEMIRFMVTPEEAQPTFNMMRAAFEDDFYQQYTNYFKGIQ